MFIVQRAARREDMAECSRCLRDGFAYDDAARDHLAAMWRELLTTGAAVAAVMEDTSAPPGRRIRWFSLSAFVTDGYMRYIRRYAPPLLGRGILRAYRDGCSPLLSYERIKEFNSHDGLNMVCLYAGSSESERNSGLSRALRARAAEFHVNFHSGYRLKEYVVELCDEASQAWAIGCGLRLRAEHAGRRALLPPAREVHPRLFGLTVAEAVERPSLLGEILFDFHEPRFNFTRGQREVLLLALTTGETDDEIAARLNVARVSVKKCWTGAYSRVLRAAGEDVFPAVPGGAPDARGREKRRRLLAYLRQHMEELRPHHAALAAHRAGSAGTDFGAPA